jgi:hypothetical protein
MQAGRAIAPQALLFAINPICCIEPRAFLVYPINMVKTVFRLLGVLLILNACPVITIPAQRDSSVQSNEENAYGSKFFDQLRTIFGRFRDADLQRVFQEALPIECSELVGRQGEWRTVAFFNENRSLGDWYRQNLEEVKRDLAVYKFTGTCSKEKETIRVDTEFPTTASIDAYNRRQIDFDHIDITVNDPVKVSMNSQTKAYIFDLPYMFLTEQHDLRNVYSLMAPDSRAAYAEDVTNRWECKMAASKDVTYRFLICRVSIIPRGPAARRMEWRPSFGSTGFFILSDGIEARSSVNLFLGDKNPSSEKPPDTEPNKPKITRPKLIRD